MSIEEKEQIIEQYRQSLCGKENVYEQDWNISVITIDDVPLASPSWRSEEFLAGYYDSAGNFQYYKTYEDAENARNERILQNEEELDRIIHGLREKVDDIRDGQHFSSTYGGYFDNSWKNNDEYISESPGAYFYVASSKKERHRASEYYVPVFSVIGITLFALAFSIYMFIQLVF